MDLLTILSAVVIKLIAGEVRDWLPTLARRLIDRAVDRLPQSDQDRYREEWYAHLDEYPGRLGKILHATGCFLKVGRLVSELKTPADGARSNVTIVTTNYDHLLEKTISTERAMKIACNILYLHSVYLDGKPRVAASRQALHELMSEFLENPREVLGNRTKSDLLKFYLSEPQLRTILKLSDPD